MSKIITLLSNKKGSGSTTVAFNLANMLKLNSKKVLLVDLEFTYSYDKYIKSLPLKSDFKNVVAPFIYTTYTKNFQILCLSNNTPAIKQIDWIKYEKALINQIENFKNTYDYIIFDTNPIWSGLVKLALKTSNIIIPIYDANNFSSTDVLKILHDIRDIQEKNTNLTISNVILNNFDRANIQHINGLTTLRKSFSLDNNLVVLPATDSLVIVSEKSLNFAKNEQWSDYALSLNSLVKQLLE